MATHHGGSDGRRFTDRETRLVFERAGAIVISVAVSFGLAVNASAQEAPPTKPQTTEISFTSYDGHPMQGKLTMPGTSGSFPVVIYVQTAEGMTVDMKRPLPNGTFNYFDL
jgi:hypothetical protein